jgi:hypothetical protein
MDVGITHNAKILSLPSDSARWAYVRLLEAAKPLGGSFASEAQLRSLMGDYYRHCRQLRLTGLLKGLDVHDWNEHQSDPDPTAAKRMREYRNRVALRNRYAVTDRNATAPTETETDTYTDNPLNTLSGGSVSRSDVEAVLRAWIEASGRTDRTQLDAKRERWITRALKKFPLEDVLAAVKGWRHSPHHRGENDSGTVYNDLELLLRDAAHIEKFRDYELRPETRPLGRGLNDTDRRVAETMRQAHEALEREQGVAPVLSLPGGAA